VIVADTEQGCGILEVIDGHSPKGIKTEADVKDRKAFLRTIGYKLQAHWQSFVREHANWEGKVCN